MFKLDDNFLIELGLGSLPAAEKNKMLAHIYETLEMKVGMRLAEKMSNEQLDEFESFINQNDEAGALKWLETNFPNYKQVVAEELEKLKSEIKQVSPQILAQAASTIQAGSPVAQPQPVQAYPASPATSPYPQPQPQMGPGQDMQSAQMPAYPASASPMPAMQPMATSQSWQQPVTSVVPQQPAYPPVSNDYAAPSYGSNPVGQDQMSPAAMPAQAYSQPAAAPSPYADPYASTPQQQPTYAAQPQSSYQQPTPMSQPQQPAPFDGSNMGAGAPPAPAYPSVPADYSSYNSQSDLGVSGFNPPAQTSSSMPPQQQQQPHHQIDFSNPQPMPQHDQPDSSGASPIAMQQSQPSMSMDNSNVQNIQNAQNAQNAQPAEPYTPPPTEPYQPPR